MTEKGIGNAEVKAAMDIIRDCLGALDACVTQIEQMRGMFDDEDGAIQEALDAADEVKARAQDLLQ